jgi:hypothetical protein
VPTANLNEREISLLLIQQSFKKAKQVMASLFGNFVQDVAGLIAVCLVLGLVLVAGQRIQRSKGRDIKWHAIYFTVVVLSFVAVPLNAKQVLFTPLSVVVVGTGKKFSNN